MSANKKTSSTASLKDKLPDEEEKSEYVDTEDQPDVEMIDHPSYQEMQQKLTEAEEKATQSWERLLRLQAEMDNMQRRTERDVANAHKYALEKFVLELLPSVDGLERALLSHADEPSGSGTLLDGVSLTLKMLYAAFEKFGIQQLSPEGQPFNPEQHQAVAAEASPDAKSGTVLSVLQKGYLLNNRLIRPALVVVAK
ncbi:MAG: GrpE protein [uncultured bacterium]|nr:MAG: GrpE protein [uncultured bacterium]